MIYPSKEYVQSIARDVEREYQMGGLSDGLYFDYAYDILCKYLLRSDD